MVVYYVTGGSLCLPLLLWGLSKMQVFFLKAEDGFTDDEIRKEYPHVHRSRSRTQAPR